MKSLLRPRVHRGGRPHVRQDTRRPAGCAACCRECVAAFLRELSEHEASDETELRRACADISEADIAKLRADLPKVAIEWKPLTDEERKALEGFLKQ